MKAWEAAKNALKCVLEAEQGESLVIVCDDEKREVGKAFAEGALALGLWARLIVLKTSEKTRRELPRQLLEVLTGQRSDVYVNLLRETREETPFRIKIIRLQRRDPRSRLGHCPGVTMEMLTEGSLALTPEEHKKMQSFADKLILTLDGAAKIDVRNPAGTSLSMSVKGREFFTDTKYDWQLRKWMNLPTGEVIVAPLENSLNGTLVCDMAIGGIGPIGPPVTMTAEKGKAIQATSEDGTVLKRVRDTLDTDEWSDIVGEFALGINPKARLVQEFLEDEKILGTIHIAFGHNLDMPGGRNASQNHMDLLMSKPTVKIEREDGSAFSVVEKGKFKV